MPSNYTGNASATESPAPTPALGAIPILALPVDTDPRNSASIYQPLKALADFEAFIQAKLAALFNETLSVYGLNADGVGNQTVTPNGGQVTALSVVSQLLTATVADSGTALANSTVAKGVICKDNIPIAWCRTSSTGGFLRGLNIKAFTKNAVGNYTVQMNVSATSMNDLCAVAQSNGTVALCVSAHPTAVDTFNVLVQTPGGVLTDEAFSLVVYTGT